jgi:hypothetical protein
MRPQVILNPFRRYSINARSRLLEPSGPRRRRNGLLYRYTLFEVDGTEAGEAHYAVLIAAGEIIWTGDGRKLRVLDVVPFEDEAASPFVGMLRVEPVA